MISDHFESLEIEVLAYSLGVDVENVLVGKGKKGRVINLTEYFRHRQQLSTLASRCQRERPQLNWPLLATDVDVGFEENY